MLRSTSKRTGEMLTLSRIGSKIRGVFRSAAGLICSNAASCTVMLLVYRSLGTFGRTSLYGVGWGGPDGIEA